MIEYKTFADWKVSGVMKLKNKYGYRVTLIMPDGCEKVRQKGGFHKMCDAQKARDLAVVQLHNNSYVVDDRYTVRDFFTMWLNEVMKQKIKGSTYYTYTYILKNHIYPLIGSIRLTGLNRGHVLHVYKTVGEKSESTAKLSRVILVTGLRYAKQVHLISVDPAKDVLIPKSVYKPVPYHEQRIDTQKTLTEDQLRLLIEKSKGTKIYLFILFAGLMGLRKSEIIGLKYSDVDFNNKTLHVQRQLGIDLSRENIAPKTKCKQEIDLKTRSSNRVIDIPDMVFNAIMEERQIYEKNRRRRQVSFQDLDYICCSSYGSPRSASYCYPHFKKLLMEANLPNIRFHDLRHTYATLLMKQDFSVKAISNSLGHAKTIISVDVYGDKQEIIADCAEEMQSFINEVFHPEVSNEYDGIFYHEFLEENLKVRDRYIKSLIAPTWS